MACTAESSECRGSWSGVCCVLHDALLTCGEAEGHPCPQVELKATRVQLVGGCDVSEYPLQKKRHTLEFLRGIAHLRPRTNTIGNAPSFHTQLLEGLVENSLMSL
jgi:hypothetical protein